MVERRRFFSCLTVILTLTACLAILEGFSRFWIARQQLTFVNVAGKIYPLAGLAGPQHYTYDAVTGYSLIPGINDPKQQITTDTNGFRTTGRKIDVDKPSIIFVGDSTVFGWGVGDAETFQYLLAQERTFKGYNIINMGVPSYSLGHIAAVLKNKVLQFNPRIVVVGILWPWKAFESYSNLQAWEKIDFDFYKKTIPFRTHFEHSEPLRKILTPHLFYVLRDVWYHIKFKQQIRENLTRPGIRDFTMSRPQEEAFAREHVRVLKQAVEPLVQKGVKVIFYIHPYQYTIFSDQYRYLGQWGKALLIKDLPALYPGDFLVKEFKREPLFIDGCHLMPAGERVFAEYFFSVLKDKI